MSDKLLANLDAYSQKTVQPFFLLACAYLICFALIVHWPLFFEHIKGLDEPIPAILVEGLWLIWLLFLADALIYLLYNYRNINLLRLLAIIVFPPLRIMYPAWHSNQYIWLPRWGWHFKNRALEKILEDRFDTPMLLIASLILPIAIVEMVFQRQLESSPALHNLLFFSIIYTWFAFTLEFLIKFGVAKNKLRFAKKNIINIAIILLPLISFLRSLRVLRAAAPFLKHGKLLNIAKTMRLRGLVMKLFKGLMTLSALQRLLRKLNRPKNLKKLYKQHEDHLEDMEELQEKMQELELKMRDIRAQIGQLEAEQDLADDETKG